jgi:hypothetical protein
MQSDDQFRLAFEAATSRLATWAGRQQDAADVIVETVGAFWRLSLVPHAANACPVELILHRDTQSFDVQFGPEVYEGQPIEAFEAFEPLLDAAVAGHVITRNVSSGHGGLALMVQTVVQPDDRIAWIAERRMVAEAQSAVAMAAAVARDRHWVPYRR